MIRFNSSVLLFGDGSVVEMRMKVKVVLAGEHTEQPKSIWLIRFW